MGEVYRARDARLDRDVALKVLPAIALTDELARARLLREARLAASLNHPHICTIYEVGETAGQLYIAMELVNGRQLNALVPSDGLPLETVVRYGREIAGAVGHAHDHGIVHRDLKGANVLVTLDGRAKVLDFGIATRHEQELEDATRLRLADEGPGVVAGTLPYLAPELLRGATADARSDVWALGVVLYEMACGHRPFHGQTSVELTSAILRDAPPPLPSHLGGSLAAIVLKCLTKDATQRYRHAAEVCVALEAVGSGAESFGSARRRDTARWPWSRTATAGAVVATVSLVLTLWLSSQAWLNRPRPTLSAMNYSSVAVLPLKNLSGDSTQDFLADGLTDALISDLTHVRGLRVISLTSSLRYKGATKSLSQIAKELKVETVVEGSV